MNPAASINENPGGIGLNCALVAHITSANDPCAEPKTLSPRAYLWLEFCGGDWVGRAVIVPENSAPAVKGKGGWCWYFPWIWRRSKKLAAEAWMRIVYWFGCGVGGGIFGEMRRPEGSYYGVRYM